MVRRYSLTLLVLLGCGLAAPGAPALRVQVGSAPVGVTGRGGEAIDFGAAPVAAVVSRTVTVTNTGAAPVTLRWPIRTPRGFTVQRRFETNTLAPGRSTTFVLALNSSLAGRLGGNVTFETSGGPVAIPVSGVVLGRPSMRIVRAGDPGYRTTGRWSSQGVAGQSAPAGTGRAAATWTFTGLAPGQYRVAATWAADARLAGNARFTVLNGTTPFTPVAVNQRVAPADLRDAGASWRVLGSSYFITGDTLSVRLTDQADGAVLAGAVRVERVGFPGRVVGVGDEGFRANGKWAASQQGTPYRQLASLPTTGATATWTVTGLVPGQYRVSAAWQPVAQGATAASYTVLDGSRALGAVALNQRQAPRDLRDGGVMWQDLGGQGHLFAIRGQTLSVRLDADRSDGPVAAGMIRVERVYNPGGATGPEGTSPGDVVRLLEQATWGPNDAWISLVQSQGIAGFVADQLYNQTPSSYPTLPLVPGNQNTLCGPAGTPGRTTCTRENYQAYLNQRQFFVNALYGPDQLIQRVSWAWHKIMVASAADNQVRPASHMVAYLQNFDYYGLTDFRSLLQVVTLNAAMGRYLSMEGSTKANPNENYAREIMQLFSIGLSELNPDGTLRLDGMGQPIPTYDQTLVTAYAKAFTGWVLAAPPQTGVQNFIDPMRVRTPETTYHDRTRKVLLDGVVVPANTATAVELGIALDSIAFNHNVAPFISKQLIQQLVTSNPTPAYVARVSQTFTNTGGDLAQTVYTILLDDEARGDVKSGDTYGKLREPAQFVNNVLRAFNALSFDQTTYSDGYLNPRTVAMAQDVLAPPSVFSYFSPFKSIPDLSPPVTMPELQILDATTALKHADFINVMTNPNGAATADGIAPTTANPPDRPVTPNGTKLDFSTLVSLAGDPNAMLDYLNMVMLHGTMTDQNRSAILPAINAVAASNPLRRAKVAVYLVATSAQYQVQR